MNIQAQNIKAELVRRGIKIKDVAAILGVTSQAVCQDISGLRSTKRIRQAIADAIGKPVSEIWPDTTNNQEAA